jgi:hypothetical protein
MKRMNLVLPEELLKQATRLGGEKSSSRAVERALREFALEGAPDPRAPRLGTLAREPRRHAQGRPHTSAAQATTLVKQR